MKLNFNFEAELESQIKMLSSVELNPDTLILREHSFIKEIPIVLEGSIKVFKTDNTGKEIVLYRIVPGQSCILSITSCLNEKESQAAAIIEKNTRLIAIPADKVKQWINEFPSWRKFVHMLYYERLEEVLSLIDNIAFKQVDMRLIGRLRDLHSEQGQHIKKTHQEIANEIGTAREVVSRLLKHLEIQGKVKLERGIITVLQPL